MEEEIEGLSLEGDETLRTVFNHLKPYCLDLLALVQNPKKNTLSLLEFADYLRSAPASGLQACLDFTLFPLLLLLDAAVLCRSQQKVGTQGKFGTVHTPYTISDSVAEGVLLCLEELLKKCPLRSVNQMVLVLKKLASGALLSPSEASEEFREGIIRCFRELLLNLHPCSVSSCICKQLPSLPTFVSSDPFQAQRIGPFKHHSESEECLLAFLQSQDASPAVGHWLSLLLQSAETEAGRGHHGSSKLRKEAFSTLRVLIAKVGTADALTFFLPGVVSQFAKVLHVSKNMISGAAGSAESLAHAVRGLTEFLIIVLDNETNIYGLGISINDITGFHSDKSKSSQSVLEALRHLPVSFQVPHESLTGHSIGQPTFTAKADLQEKSIDSHCTTRSLYVKRTKDWIEETSAHVDKLLCATFPHLCVHPSKKVRHGLVDGIQGLLSKCSYTLKKSKLMLLECLCVLVCDDSEAVAIAAQEILQSLFMVGEKRLTEFEVSEIFTRLIEKLPRVVLGSEEALAVSHAQRLLAVMYYAGPQLVVDHLLCSPITASRFFDVLMLSMSHNSVFSGSVDKLILAKPHSVGYLQSVAELKSGTFLSSGDHTIIDAAPAVVSSVPGYYELPRSPPWFAHGGGQKLYQVLGGVLRLAGLSIMADQRSEISLSTLADIPLDYFRKLIQELRMKQYSKESWHSWYPKSRSGQLLRQASTAACILNEFIYGISNQSIDSFSKVFQKTMTKVGEIQGKDIGDAGAQHGRIVNTTLRDSAWKVYQGNDAKSRVIDCVGSVLHEYLSPEVWDLPIDQNSFLLAQETDAVNLPLHFFRDTMMLHQVIIDGIGIFGVTLGKDFITSGFLHASLYLLLENLMCSSYQIRWASDAVLHVLSASSRHPSVGHLVISNADYIIDSLCRQLRHLDINPHVPDVLAAMLSYIGVAHEILPLLEEPMRTVSAELEVLGRYQRPYLTIPFLKAVSEIAKASRHEACAMANAAESYFIRVKSKVLDLEKMVVGKNHKQSDVSHDSDGGDMGSLKTEKEIINTNGVDLQIEQWEEMLFKLNDARRYRRTVGSVLGSCLTTATPILASMQETACLVALEIVEVGIATLAKVEEAYKHEKETKDAIERAFRLISFNDLEDPLDATDEGTDENRLLPAMNKIWPYLVHCLKNKNLVVVRRCLTVVSRVVQVCGGGFFTRRFQTDGSHFWKLLTASPFQRKPISKEKKHILLPYRGTSTSSSDSVAEISSLKVQASVLEMIADISKNKISAPAFEAVLKKVSGLIVGIACSSVTGLRDPSINALSGLASIDPDLIWLLVADIYFSLVKDKPFPPHEDLTEIPQLLPPPPSPKDYLYRQYGGETFGFDVNLSAAEMVFRKLQSEVFT
ncbi:ARM repeat superfamily protein isoform X1 [Tasmannia lanceolata]|uniref:ARM repeat superfamily protein isoform X1 n=2 Tax=Tasmannia lanceolata TaxID=3420 RepID=UPI0040640D5F